MNLKHKSIVIAVGFLMKAPSKKHEFHAALSVSRALFASELEAVGRGTGC
jgi:hypothetical protein